MALRRIGLVVAVGLVTPTAMSPSACSQQKRREFESAQTAANRSQQELAGQIGRLEAATSALRARFQALPEDLPGLETVHSDLFALEEVLGVEGARVKWLSGELDNAVTAANLEQIQKVSAATRGAIEGTKEIDGRILSVTQRLQAFERTAAHRSPS